MEQQYATEIWTNEHRCKFLFFARVVWDVGERSLLHVILAVRDLSQQGTKASYAHLETMKFMSRINYFTRNTWVTEPREAEVNMWSLSILIYKVGFELYRSINIY